MSIAPADTFAQELQAVRSTMLNYCHQRKTLHTQESEPIRYDELIIRVRVYPSQKNGKTHYHAAWVMNGIKMSWERVLKELHKRYSTEPPKLVKRPPAYQPAQGRLFK